MDGHEWLFDNANNANNVDDANDANNANEANSVNNAYYVDDADTDWGRKGKRRLDNHCMLGML